VAALDISWPCEGTYLASVKVCPSKGDGCTTFRASCFPHGCDSAGAPHGNPPTFACRNVCTSDDQCAVGAHCWRGACIAHIWWCAPAPGQLFSHKLTNAEGKLSSCDPYGCKDDRCLATCTSGLDCASGFVCSSKGACEPVPCNKNSQCPFKTQTCVNRDSGGWGVCSPPPSD
jgi:hypothetical protein